MRAVFIHSSRVMRASDGEVYARSQFPYRVWGRYLKHFEEITVVMRMTDCKNKPEKWDLSSGRGVTFVGVPDDHGMLVQKLRNGLVIEILRREIVRCDAVIVRMSPIGWLAAQEAEKHGIPWAVEVVGNAWDAFWNYGTLPGKLYAPVAWWQARKWIAKAPYALYVTQEFLQRRFPCAGVVSHASNVHLEAVDESILENRIMNSQKNCRVWNVGLIGDLFARYKGLHVAIQSLLSLRNQGVDVHLHVLGDGNLDAWQRDAKMKGVIDLLHFDGVLPSGDSVMRWLDDLDLYIQPSYAEGLPRGLIEAMSRGLPCLASKVGGIPELLPSECLHTPGDSQKMAQDMLRAINDVEWRVTQAKRNFLKAQEYYTDKLNDRRDAFWEKFIEHIKSVQSRK